MSLPTFLQRFKTEVFIETGSHYGDGIQQALDSGFPLIFSADVSPIAHGYCMHRFRHHRDKVDLFLGDSRQLLRKLLPNITTKITFWLDAHPCGTDGGNVADVPLLEELQIIGEHPIKDHHILIDDVRLFGVDGFPTAQDIIGLIYEINPDYSVSYVDGREFVKDILLATVL